MKEANITEKELVALGEKHPHLKPAIEAQAPEPATATSPTSRTAEPAAQRAPRAPRSVPRMSSKGIGYSNFVAIEVLVLFAIYVTARGLLPEWLALLDISPGKAMK